MNLRRSLMLLTLLGWSLPVGCTGDDTGDDGAATSSSSGQDDHAHATDDSGTADSGTTAAHDGTDEHGSDHQGVETSSDDPHAAYCACVFANCHEPYHAKWGDDEVAAEAACLAEAEGLPVNGSDIEMGNFLECRMHFCELAATDETVCANALGEAVCL